MQLPGVFLFNVCVHLQTSGQKSEPSKEFCPRVVWLWQPAKDLMQVRRLESCRLQFDKQEILPGLRGHVVYISGSTSLVNKVRWRSWLRWCFTPPYFTLIGLTIKTSQQGSGSEEKTEGRKPKKRIPNLGLLLLFCFVFFLVYFFLQTKTTFLEKKTLKYCCVWNISSKIAVTD